MSLKNRLSKMKNFLFDEEDVKEEKKEIKKDKKKKSKEKKEIFNDDSNVETINLDDDFTYDFKNDYTSDYENNDVTDIDIPVTKSRIEKQEFTIPELTDDDFLLQEKKEIKEVEPLYEKPLLYQGSKKRKDEVKRFKPSPIISPIYGLLDEKGNKINDDKETVDMVLNNKDEISLDDVRKKAYGKLDDEIEDTLKKLSSKTIEEAEKQEKLSREVKKEKKNKEIEKKEIDFDEPEELEDDEMILPSVSFKEINVDSKTRKEETDDDDDEETKEQDLFNLIDSMYEKDGEE